MELGVGAFFFNPSVPQQPKIATLEEMTIRGYSFTVNTDLEGNV